MKLFGTWGALRRAGLGGLLLLGAVLPAGSAAAPPGAVPVFCDVRASKGVEEVLSCRRPDTGASFTAVPSGQYLHVTDLLANRNTLADTGDFYLTLGRDDGGSYPAEPKIDLSGIPTETKTLHFRTPVIVLGEGESLVAYTDSSSDFPLNLYVTGYLATSVSP